MKLIKNKSYRKNQYSQYVTAYIPVNVGKLVKC